ncbi:MurR/RpiR family transcriptional regulator [Nocardioides fonticola]|uniref:MurR/RpiR family transcriptional regulator n=1 Tax=Nocardioides fonticola TaxID=450363 RepID=A0ABP7XLE4_9ACTN
MSGVARSEAMPGDAARAWLIDRCREHRLSPAQRRVAQFLADTMPDAAFLSTSEAAARAGVSQPSVTRFAATLGFASYADFREQVREIALGSGERAVRVLPAGGPDAVDEAQATLDRVRPVLRSEALAGAVEALVDSETWAFLGLRASTAIARYGAYFAARIHDDVRVVIEADTLLDRITVLAASERRSTLVVVAMPRYPAATVAALRHAAALGLTTVLVVDDPYVDFAAEATHVLTAPVGTGLVFDTHTAPLLLLSALIDGVAAADPHRTQERLEAHEVLVDTWQYRP